MRLYCIYRAEGGGAWTLDKVHETPHDAAQEWLERMFIATAETKGDSLMLVPTDQYDSVMKVPEVLALSIKKAGWIPERSTP